MRQSMITVLVSLASLLCTGCDDRVPVVVGSRLAPDGRHVLWVMNEYGGLRSGVVYVHLTKRGERPELRNEVLRTPECEGTVTAWLDQDTIVILYDEIFGSFHSELRSESPRVIIADRRDAGRMGIVASKPLPLPCDPY